jgi:hypothetical protein
VRIQFVADLGQAVLVDPHMAGLLCEPVHITHNHKLRPE